MSRYICSIFIALSMIVMPATAFGWDSGYSHNLFFKKTLSDRWSFVSRSLFTSRNDMTDIFFGTADLGMRYKVNSTFSIDGVYRGAWFDEASGWKYENRPLVNFNFTKRWKGYTAQHRSRFEFRTFDHKEDDIRYRSEYRFIAPFEFTPLKLKPFVEEEFFYSFDDQAVNMNWVTGGVRYKLNDNTTVKLGYRWHTQKLSGQWRNRHVMVTGLLFFF